MLQIRLNKGSSSEGGIGAKCLPGETVTVACPDHLVLADLPVAKVLGSETSASIVKIVGRRSRRQLAERVHFCVRCDFPIAVYGRLSPCEHAFCLDCARSDSICYLCDERIQKIQSMKMMEGIFICAAPHCLKSFLKKSEFESHIHHSHADLIQLNMKKEAMDESEASGPRPTSTMDTTLRGPTRPPFPSNPNPQSNDRDDKGRRPQHRDQPSFRPLMHPMQPPQLQPTLSEPQPNSQGSTRQEFGQFSDPRHEYPQIYPPQPPNFQMMFGQPPYGFPPQFYGTSGPYGMARSNSGQEGGTEQGSVVGFSPGPGGPVNFPEGYSSPWNMGPKNASSEASQGGGLSLSGAPQGTPPPPPPPPGPPPPHLMQPNNSYFSGETSNDGKNYGWQPERHGSIGGSQD